MSAKSERPIIIVRRIKRADDQPHGGAWKVAYADFVTAMMAFFLVMWLIASVSKDQRAAIFEYFRNPSMEQGKSVRPAPGQMGPGGASTSVIDLGGALDARRSATPVSTGLGTPRDQLNPRDQQGSSSLEQARKITEAAEHQKLESLMIELRQAIDKSQALKPFKDQLLLDITPEGLRIQIVDAQNRPMFDLGSAKLKGYTAEILHELAPYLNSVPNQLSLSGHTDTTPYTAQAGYNNWDLSSDRANAARRALEAGGLEPAKVARIVGLSSAVLFDKSNPRAAINRRISIVVMTKEAEEAALKTDDAPGVSAADLSHALAAPAGAPTAPTPTAATPTVLAPAPAPGAGPGPGAAAQRAGSAPPTSTLAPPGASALVPTAAPAGGSAH
ncbi:MAG TPA: flagellar motor protein MotB [Steroidobacteraceae bacterium]|jgi:chemotaxis protein MotB|nr:flagellar motor protein MotB [Steroidobacteraceae bacterium]